MRSPWSGTVRLFVAAWFVLLLSASAASAAKLPVSPVSTGSGLDSLDRATLQKAEEQGRARVTLLIAAKPDRIDRVTAGVIALGGKVDTTQNRIDYVKAVVPVEAAPKVAKLAAIEAVDVNRLIPLDDPRVQGQAPAAPQDPPDADTPRANPYLPIQDTGAAAFGEAPERDGRGVKVAVLDSGIDLGQPDLQTASTAQPKVIDWYDELQPGAGFGSWVATEGRVTGSFVREGKTWIAPATGGPYAFGKLLEDAGDLATGLIAGDLDRDGVTGETFGVLQNRTTKEVYVDTNQNRDFTDDYGPMLDYRVAHDFSFFGVDNPATPIREQMAFSVGTDRSTYQPASDDGSWVNIGVSGSEHGTHVAGIIGATGMFGGAMSGAAPGAQLISVKVCPTFAGCPYSGLIDGMIYAAENGADVANLSVGGATALNDGDNARAELYNRLIDEYGMQIFVSAGNDGGGANTVGDPGVAQDVISVAASITKESWLSNYGQDNATANGLMPFSSRGPSEAGAMKPDLAAPGSAVSTTLEWTPGVAVDEIYSLPPGYSMLNGTSMASPQAAGAAALLIGTYKDEFGSEPSPTALRNALISTANFLPGTPALGQGAGLIDVEAAWQQLRLAAPVAPWKIKATVPVNTVLSSFLPVPGQGVGIHEREGLKKGEQLTRNYTLTRTTGPAGSRAFEVSWKGNDGTFASATTVSLPLDTPITLPVQLHPTEAGVHSALLQLDDPVSTGVDLTTQNVVFATDETVDSRVQKTGTVGRGNVESMLIDVPPGTPVLGVHLEAGGPGEADGQARFRLVDPQGMNAETMSTVQCFNPEVKDGCPAGSPTRRTITDPAPGVWEVVVEAYRAASVQETPFTVTANLLAATVSPDPDEVRAPDYGPVHRTYEATNEGASFSGRMIGGAMSSTRVERPEISQGEQSQFPVTVPPGADRLIAEIDNPSSTGTDLDLLLYYCPSGCILVDRANGATSKESVSAENPAAGSWVVLVDGNEVPGAATSFDYRDSITSLSRYGEITVNDTESARAPGATWSADATVSPVSNDPGAGRKLTGKVKVVNEIGVEIGSGDVEFVIDAVPPTTTITSGPDTPSRDVTPSFTFESDESGTFECSLDDEPFSACETPLTLGALEDGAHTLAVRAVDAASNEDATPATYDFVIDTTGPTTEIESGPPAVGTNRSPTFEFTADEPGSTFECRLDGQDWQSCSLGFTATDLADGEDGEHIFEVRATDPLENTGAAASTEFTLTAPTVLEAAAVTGTWQGNDLRVTTSAKVTHGRTGDAVAGRTVTFKVGATPLCEGETDGSGNAECSGTLVAAGPSVGDRYTATFAGEPRFAAASAEGSLTVPPSTDPPDPPDPPGTDPGTVCPAIKLGFRLTDFDARPPFGDSRRVPGIRVRLSAGKVKANIKPRLRYRVSGKTRSAKLKSRSLRVKRNRNIRFLIPPKMKRDFRRAGLRLKGAPVTLFISAKLRQTTAPKQCTQAADTRRLRTKVVGVASRVALRRLGVR